MIKFLTDLAILYEDDLKIRIKSSYFRMKSSHPRMKSS